jgi:predicted deacylase
MIHPRSPDAPRFDVLIKPPDLTPWLVGDCGIPGIITRESGRAGPHVALLSLMHGNEFAGAIVLDRLLRDHLTPVRGKLSFAFVNIAAFENFDPREPTLSRFVDEDINRLWEDSILTGPRHSVELDRAREIRPLIDQANVVMDLHSMLWPSDPLILCGATKRGRAIGQALGWPPTVVADAGHANGPRLIDYARFTKPNATAILVEAGQHWRQETVDTAMASVSGLLRHFGLVSANAAMPPPPPPRTPARFAVVTDVVTARTNAFSFVRAWHGGEVVANRNTVIALDGVTEIRTPYDNCLLVMPSLRPGRGHTAVRLAKLVV